MHVKQYLTFILFPILYISLFYHQALSSVIVETPGNPEPLIFIIDYDYQLLRVENIDIDGEYYNVSFVDGSAENIYRSYEQIFTGETEALRAVSALMNALDGTDIADNPSMISGMYNTDTGYIYTVYSCNDDLYYMASLTIYGLDSSSSAGSMVVSNSSLYEAELNDNPSADFDSTLFAIWTKSDTSTVPIPSALILLGTGLLTIVGFKRCKNKWPRV
jgi:hypothetical protein